MVFTITEHNRCLRCAVPLMVVLFVAAGLLLFNLMTVQSPQVYQYQIASREEKHISPSALTFAPETPAFKPLRRAEYEYKVGADAVAFTLNVELPRNACSICQQALFVTVDKFRIGWPCEDRSYNSMNLTAKKSVKVTYLTKSASPKHNWFELTFRMITPDNNTFSFESGKNYLKDDVKSYTDPGLLRSQPDCMVYASSTKSAFSLDLEWWHIVVVIVGVFGICCGFVFLAYCRQRRMQMTRDRPLPDRPARRTIDPSNFTNTRNRDLPRVFGSTQLASAFEHNRQHDKPPDYANAGFESIPEQLPVYDDVAVQQISPTSHEFPPSLPGYTSTRQ